MTSLYTTIWTPIDEPPGAAHYLHQWRDSECATSVICRFDSDAQPLVPALQQVASAVQFLPHALPAPVQVRDHVVGQVRLPATQTFGTATPKRPMELPLTAFEVKQLHALSEASSLGVEGRGTVYDPALRKSREIRADDDGPLRLSDALRTFDFAEARQQIQEALCATAVEVEYRPYKLVLYAPGDFFAAHGDSMSDASMFGSLALQIPVAAGCEPGASGDVGGALVFHPGTPREASVDLTTVLPCDGTDGVRVTFAAWLGDVQHEVRVVKQPRIVLLYRLFKRGHVRPQRLAPVKSRIRRSLDAVFDTSAPCHLPMMVEFPPQYHDYDYVPQQANDWGTASGSEATRHQFVGPGGCAMIPDAGLLPLSCVGIMLQHRYPPAGLTPTELKGTDAALYEVVSGSHLCHLVSVLEPRYEPYDPIRFPVSEQRRAEEREQEERTVVRVAIYASSMGYGSMYDEARNHPLVLAAWVPGGGAMDKEGGGSCLGNWDCSTAWWYRSAALIVLGPSRWGQCRWFYLAVLKGDAPGLQRLYAVQDVFQHVLRYVS